MVNLEWTFGVIIDNWLIDIYKHMRSFLISV